MLRDLVREKDEPVFIDVGANVGQHSLFLSRYCKQVHAFEPYEPVRRQLESNIQYNDIRNILVHNVGLGDSSEELDFYAPKGANTATGSFVPSHETDNNEKTGKLKVVNGDKYFSNLGLDKIDLVKIDVEGFEKSVLKGLENTIRDYRPALLMEFSDTTQASFTGVDELQSMFPEGYRIKRVISNSKYFVFFNRAKYKLIDFDFGVPGGNLLLSPQIQKWRQSG